MIHTGPWRGADTGLAGISWIEPVPPGSGITGHLFYGNRPLHAGGAFPDGTNAKVLWTFERPVSNLELTATPAETEGGSPVSIETGPANTNNGVSTQWPSLIDVPTADCWQLTLDATDIDGRKVHGVVIFVAVD